MGFVFEPPIEYFDKIFKHFSKYDLRPAFQLFGGEPTVREDLIDIVKMAKSYQFPVRVVTNGIKLAKENYCRQLIKNGATILIAYDGSNPDTYRILRGNEKYLELKQTAIENIRRIGKAKVVLMSLVAKGFNDQTSRELIDYVHERRDFIRGVYFMPLVHTWKDGAFDFEPARITTEDVEGMIENVFPEDRIDFIPAGFLGQLPNIMKYLKLNPMPFVGAHPNCESMYLLISNGEEYSPVSRYLHGSILELCRDFLKVEHRLARRVGELRRSLVGRLLGSDEYRALFLRFWASLFAGRTFLRHVRVSYLLRGKGLGRLCHLLALPLSMIRGARTKTALAQHTTIESVLQLIILPFEDRYTLETDRMERCPSAFAFYDPLEDRVKTVPSCAWLLHKTEPLRMIAEYYENEAPKKVAS
jgi:hypothetical protein